VSAFEWKKHRRALITHAYRQADLAAAASGDRVEPVAFCESFPAEDLIRDDDAEKCRPCQRVVERAAGAR
jgi:hypothetical protein